jgi:hypothetical protein
MSFLEKLGNISSSDSASGERQEEAQQREEDKDRERERERDAKGTEEDWRNEKWGESWGEEERLGLDNNEHWCWLSSLSERNRNLAPRPHPTVTVKDIYELN